MLHYRQSLLFQYQPTITILSKSLLSIVIPVYNSSKYLDGLMRDIILEKYSNLYEIILVNDFSKDNSLSICKKYQKKYTNVSLLSNKSNLGVGTSRNLGLKKSKGKYVFFLDSDDRVNKKNLYDTLKMLNKIDDEVIFFNFIDHDLKSKNLFSNKKCKNKIFLLKQLYRKQSINYCFQYFYNREFILKNRLYFEDIRYAEDFIFITKVFCLMKKFKKIDKILVKHHLNPDGLSFKINIKNDITYLYALEVLQKFEKSLTSKIKNYEKAYLNKRKFDCLNQLFLRFLNYNFLKIINIKNQLITNKGKIKTDISFYTKKKHNNIKSILDIMFQKILNFVNQSSKKETIGIYGYGVIGRAIESFLKRNGFKRFIIFDEKKMKVKNNQYNFDKLILLKKIFICVPHLYNSKKIFDKLKKIGVKKSNLFQVSLLLS